MFPAAAWSPQSAGWHGNAPAYDGLTQKHNEIAQKTDVYGRV